MFAATRRWFRRNRGPIAVGFGVVGAGYVATQYLLAKLSDARERMSSDRIAKENLRRRFEQNQEDCTFTVLALLPTVATNVLEAMNTEGITYQIQRMKAGAAGKPKSESGGSAGAPSIADTLMTEDEGKSMISIQSESGVHASQVVVSAPTSSADGPAATPQEGGNPLTLAPKRKTKRQLWDELTISSITRAYTLLYTTGLLIMLTRIQLNLLGRRSYLSSVVSLAAGSSQATISLENNDDDNPQHVLGSSDFEVNRKYLAFSWWLLNRSWEDIAQRVEASVRTVFGPLSPRDLISLETFGEMTRQVRQNIELAPFPIPSSAAKNGNNNNGSFPPSRWLPLVLPPPGMEEYVLRESGILADSAAATFEQIQRGEATGEAGETKPKQDEAAASLAQSTALRRMLDETADLVDSPTFSQVLTELLDAGFTTLIENKIAPAAFDLPPMFADDSEQVDLMRLRSEKKVQLPKVLSVLTRQAHVIGSGMPNEYLQEMEAVRDLEAFAAVVYSSNWENEVRDEGLLPLEPTTTNTTANNNSSSAGGSSPPSGPPVEESIVIVDDEAYGSLESAWERAVEKS